MKKILSWLLVLCMICSLLPVSVLTASAAVAGGDCSREGDGSVQWSYDSATYTLTISGNGYMQDYDSCALEYDPYFTGDCSLRPWESYSSLKTVIVEEGVKNIGCRAFASFEKLNKVVLPDGLKWIGEEAFANCKSLPYIGIPNGVESIGISAFYGDFHLETVVLSEGLTMISPDMFSGCSALCNVTIPASVEEIDDSAFVDTYSTKTIYYGGSSSQWSALGEVDVSYGRLRYNASFATFGAEGNNLGWIFNSENGYFSLFGSGAMSNDSSGTAPWYSYRNNIMNVTIGKNVTAIGSYAFSGHSALTEVTLPEGLVSLGNNSFYDCDALISVTIPGSVTEVASCSFYKCDGLKTATIQEGTTYLNSSVFNSCTSLTTVYLPASLTEIDKSVFYGCDSLKDVYFAGSKTQWEKISVSPNNDILESATIHFAVADEPATSGTCGAEGENLTWSYDPETCTLTISGSGAMAEYDQGRTLPWAEFAENITSIVFDGNVTSVGDYAFAGFTSLEAIVIPNSVTRIGGGAFRECPSLKQITLHPSITYMGDKMFTYSEALEIVYFNGTMAQWLALDKGNGNTILDSVEVIPLVEECKHSYKTTSRADATCTENGSVTVICVDCGEVISTEVIPATGHSYTYTNNGEEHVVGCNNCSYSMTEEHTYAEGSCICGAVEDPYSGTCGAEGDNLTWHYYTGNHILYISGSGDMAEFKEGAAPWSEHTGYIEEIVFEGNVTSIGDYAFVGCIPLDEVVIPDTVTDIGECAFRNCRMMTAITIPSSVTSIGSKAFSLCEALQAAYYTGTEEQWDAFDHGNGNVILDNGPVYFNAKEGNTYGTCGAQGNNLTWTFDPTTGTLFISGRGDMADNAYSWSNSAVTNVVIGKNVTSIGATAFIEAYELTEIEIPGNVTTIGNDAFAFCENLRKVTIGSGVEKIESDAFYSCESLKELTIPVTVQAIDEAAFNMSGIGSLYYEGTEDQWAEVNDGIAAAEGIAVYFNAKEGNSYGTCGAQGNNLTWTFDSTTGALTIGGSGDMATFDAFGAPWDNCAVKSLTIGENVTSLSAWAFHCACNLTEAVIPNSVTSAGEECFSFCDSLQKVTIGKNLTVLPSNMFCNCEALTTVSNNANWTSIEAGAFRNCNSLAAISLPSSLKTIGNSAFEFCSSLENIYLPFDLTSLGFSAFEKSGLTEINLPDGMLTSVGFNAFANCKKLVSAEIGFNMTDLPRGLFEGCSALTTVRIPAGVKCIEDSAFNDCNALTDVYYRGSEEMWSKLPIGIKNDPLNTATIHYGSEATIVSGTCGDAVEWRLDLSSGILLILGEGEMKMESSKDSPPWSSYYDVVKVAYVDEGITNLIGYAFEDFYCLNTIYFPSSITKFGSDATFGCDMLTDVYYGGDAEQWDSLDKSHNWRLERYAEIHYNTPYGSCGEADDVLIWRLNTNEGMLYIEGNDTIPDYSNQPSEWCTYEITSVYLADGVTGIGSEAFSDMEYLALIRIPSSVSSIGEEAFTNCDQLNHILYGGTEDQWYSIHISASTLSPCDKLHFEAIGDEVYWTGKEGYEYLYCSICGEIVIESNCDHTDASATETVAPSCTEDGYTTYTCNICGCSFVEVIPATGHVNTTTTTVDATCTEDGSITVTCACGEVVSVEVIPTPGHIYDVIITEPTCTEDGYTTYNCSVCGDTYTTDVVPATGHVNTTTTTVEATCTEDGSITVTCACGEVVSVETIDALGHNYGKTVTVPTCTEDGYTTYTCDRCGDTYTADVVPAIGHSYTYINNGEDHTVGCGNCDYSAVESHTYVDGTCICGAVEVVEPTQANIKIGHGVALESDLCVKYRVKYSDLSAAVPNYVTDGAYLVIEKDVYPAGGEKTVITYELDADLDSDPARMVFNLAGIQSAEMGSELRAVLHVFDAEGREYISAVDVYSIKTYVETTLKNVTYETQPKMVTMLIDLLNYGAAAQISFGRRTDELVNAGFEAYQQYATTELSAPLTDSKDTVSNDRTITAVTKMGFSVNLADKTEINAKLTLAAGYTMEDISKVVILNEAGEQVDVITEFALLEDGRVQVTFSGVKSINMRDMFYFVAYVGEEVASDNVGYSVEAAAKTSIATGTGSNVDAMRACMYYGDSACAYFGK